jgi:outer membrane protein
MAGILMPTSKRPGHTTVTWRNAAALGGVNVKGDADVDPWIFSAGLAYRFNLGDVFGHRAETAYIK